MNGDAQVKFLRSLAMSPCEAPICPPGWRGIGQGAGEGGGVTRSQGDVLLGEHDDQAPGHHEDELDVAVQRVELLALRGAGGSG